MKTDFSTAPLASGLRGADGGTVEKSQRAPYTKKLTLPNSLVANGQFVRKTGILCIFSPFLACFSDFRCYGRLPLHASNSTTRAITQSSSGAAAPSLTLRARRRASRSEEHTSELQSLMRISYAVFCLKKKKQHQ